MWLPRCLMAEMISRKGTKKRSGGIKKSGADHPPAVVVISVFLEIAQNLPSMQLQHFPPGLFHFADEICIGYSDRLGRGDRVADPLPEI
jgi:hypothetical protein